MARQVCGVTMKFEGEGTDLHAHRPHEAYFPKLADQTVEVKITATGEKTDALLDLLRAEGIRIFFVRTPVEFGILGETA